MTEEGQIIDKPTVIPNDSTVIPDDSTVIPDLIRNLGGIAGRGPQ
jgi:hypothetical protein